MPNVRIITIMVGPHTSTIGGMTGIVTPGLQIRVTEIITGVDTGATTNKIIMWTATAAHNHADAIEIGVPNIVQEALAAII